MFEVVNYSWTVNDVSHVSRVWHADAQTASDTTGAVNSPDSTSLLLSHLRISCDTRAVKCLKAIFWQWRLFKTPGNLKKKNFCWLFQSLMLQYRQRPQGGRHPKDRREFIEVAAEHLWGFVGLHGRGNPCTTIPQTIQKHGEKLHSSWLKNL